MKRTSFIVIILTAITLQSCLKVPKETPDCIKEMIKNNYAASSCEDITVDQYYFQDQIVYTFSVCPDNPDAGIEVYSEECYYLGFLNGFSGNQYINGVKFYEHAEFVQTIWVK